MPTLPSQRWFRDRFRHLADNARTEAMRRTLMNMAQLCEVESELLEKSKRCLAESEELITKADTLLSAQAATARGSGRQGRTKQVLDETGLGGEGGFPTYRQPSP